MESVLIQTMLISNKSNVSYGYYSNSISNASYAINSMERINLRNPTNNDTVQLTTVYGKRGRPYGKHGRSPLLSNPNPILRSSMKSTHVDDVRRPLTKKQQTKTIAMPLHRNKNTKMVI